MNKKVAFLCLFFLVILGSVLPFYTLDATAAPSANEKTLVLYDAASGTIPGTPLLQFADFPPGAAPPAYSDGATLIDTTTSGRDTYAGWTSNEANTPGFPILDRSAGFQLDFSLQVEDESHRSNHRSGFSLILLDEDAKGIELAFWEDEIWAQSDSSTGGLFQHGEGVVFPTTAGFVDYRLSVIGDTYTLTANTQPILSGPLRDYSAFDGFPDPYQTANFLFLGDNTTSAQARVRLRFISITGIEPVMPTSTGTSTSTSSPLPTASLTPLPSPTPVPSQTPASQGFDLCPSAGIILVVIATMHIMLTANTKKVSKNLQNHHEVTK